MKILVSLKRVADPDNANKIKVSGDGKAITSEGLEWKPNPFDEYAVETALRLNENAAKNEKLGEVVVMSIGAVEVMQTLRQALFFASAMASFCVEGFSIERLEKLSKADVAKRVRELEKMTKV